MTACASDRLLPGGFRAVLWLCLPLLAGCGTLTYYAQALEGHADLLRRRVPAAGLLQDPATPEALRGRLAQALEARAFASRVLALPDNGSYTGYSDLERPQALWNVFAAPEFSLAPRSWCAPFAGCVAYRGWFSEAAARQHAAALREEGQDVYVAPVSAYSTLGWSDDPLTNVMLALDEARLAALLFHELAHQRVYVPGDSAFNEGYAVAVEEAGVERWLAERPEVLAQWRRQREQARARRERLLQAKRDLQALYAQPLAADAMRARKHALLCALDAALTAPGDAAPGITPCEPRHNNASLAAVGVYHELAPAFHALLARQGGDFAAFHQAVAALAALPPAARREHLLVPH